MELNSNRAVLSFTIQLFEGELAVTPLIDGALLSETVSRFESARGFEPAGGYGGLIPHRFKFGPLDEYFLGEFEPDSYFAKMKRIYLLGCGSCGEVGCWPLLARVDVGVEEVLWDSFEQPFRHERDYSAFGPLVFAAQQYRKAVESLWHEFKTRIQEP